MHYVIIGGGIAGTTAAEELRKLDASAEITLISEEFHVLYSRVLLPHYVKGKIPRERVFLKKESWYQEQNIEWIRGETVLRVDPKNAYVGLSSGREIPFDKLLIASGSEVKLLDQETPSTSYLRTLDDADHLLNLLRAFPKDGNALIYGGGFIACEYLNIFFEANIKTTIAYRGAHMWSRGISYEAGMLIQKQLEKNGITVLPNTKEIESIPYDLLGIGVGVAPHFSFLQDSGINVQNGILANQFLETNQKDIFVAGDVAEFFDERFDRHFITGNWMNAQMQGRLAARNMFGEKKAFDLVSSYAMNIVGIDIIFIGDTSRAHAEEIQLIGSAEEGGIAEVFFRKNILVGAILTGRNKDRAELTKLIQDKSGRDTFVNKA